MAIVPYTTVTAGGNTPAQSANPFSGGTTALGLNLDKKSLKTPVVIKNTGPSAGGTGMLGAINAGLATGQQQAATSTVENLLGLFRTGNDLQVEAIQRAVFDAGFYPRGYYTGKNPKEPVWGSVDDDSLKAYAKALLEAGRSKRPVDDVLAAHTKAFSKTLADHTAAQVDSAPIIRTQNPADIHAVLDKMVRARLGKRDDNLVEQMLMSFLKLEQDHVQQQRQLDGTSLHPGPGGNLQELPDPSTFADQQLKQLRPDQYAASEMGQQAQAAVDIIHGK